MIPGNTGRREKKEGQSVQAVLVHRSCRGRGGALHPSAALWETEHPLGYLSANSHPPLLEGCLVRVGACGNSPFESPVTTVTNSHERRAGEGGEGGLQQQAFTISEPGGWKSQIQVWAGLGPSEVGRGAGESAPSLSPGVWGCDPISVSRSPAFIRTRS